LIRKRIGRHTEQHFKYDSEHRMITAAVIHLLWIAFAGTDALATLPIGEDGLEISRLWIASGISLATAVLIFRTV